MPETQLAAEHLFTLTATTQQVAVVQGAPQGSRVHVRVTGGTFEGPKLRGVIEDGGGDWLTLRQDGSIKLDVRITLKTDDGAYILATYTGIGTPIEGGFTLRTAPLFETGDERYAWLNNVQAVGIGQPGKGTVTYDVYALK